MQQTFFNILKKYFNVFKALTVFFLLFNTFGYNLELTNRKTRPPLVTVAMPDIQCRSHTTHMFSRSEKYIAEQRGN